MRFAILGAGFWAKVQLAAWREVGGAECIAICDPVLEKAQTLARHFGIPNVYTDPTGLLESEPVEFLDLVSPVETHAPLVSLAAARNIPVICQKPMASTLKEAEAMVALCRKTQTPFFVHENWRWQTPIREIKRILDSGVIGRPFRARIDMISGFPVFVNQPFFRELERFLLTDMGSHILDVARFLFGEASRLTSHIGKVHPDIKGEDVATVMMDMGGVTVICEMAYAENFLEREVFPQTLIFIEGTNGSLELDTDYRIRVTTSEGTHVRRTPPPHYHWADPAYDVVQSSMVSLLQNLLLALKGEGEAETTGEDNLKTVKLVFAAYDSAKKGETVKLK